MGILYAEYSSTSRKYRQVSETANSLSFALDAEQVILEINKEPLV
jgi:hypothetical protein